jgi:cytochrome c oxidase subunit III
MRSTRPELQFATLAQQGETAQLGMWVFIATETMFFGGLLFGYFVYRTAYPAEFAEASRDTELWCGSVNVGILLTSSLTMVLSIVAAAADRRRALCLCLLATALLGVVFLAVKGYEYYADYDHQVVPALDFILRKGETPASEMFWVFYFIATGLHALHLTIAIGLVLMLLHRARQGRLTSRYYTPIEVVALYWSFVDIVWIFLFPAIYLAGRA